MPSFEKFTLENEISGKIRMEESSCQYDMMLKCSFDKPKPAWCDDLLPEQSKEVLNHMAQCFTSYKEKLWGHYYDKLSYQETINCSRSEVKVFLG